MNSSEKAEGPAADRTQKTATITAAGAYPDHQTYMHYTLGSRLEWMRRHEHWWIREVRRHQAECDWCRRCDPEVAA